MKDADIKILLIESLRKIDSLMNKCETLPNIREHGIENLQHEMKTLKEWLKARESIYFSIKEASLKLSPVRWNSQPSTFYTHLYDANIDIGNSLTSFE